MFLKLRNKILMYLGGRSEITGVNTGPEIDEASYDTLLFHWIMKEPVRYAVQMMPEIPQAWIENLTGSRKRLYEISKAYWHDVDGNSARLSKLWKPFIYFIVLWENDEVTEPADRVLYEMLKRRGEFYINLDRQDPGNWYRDSNPLLPNNRNGRVQCIFREDPEIRFDSLTELLSGGSSIVTRTRPDRNFICIRERNGEHVYLMINRWRFVREDDGGYRYDVISKKTDQIEAATLGAKIERSES